MSRFLKVERKNILIAKNHVNEILWGKKLILKIVKGAFSFSHYLLMFVFIIFLLRQKESSELFL